MRGGRGGGHRRFTTMDVRQRFVYCPWNGTWKGGGVEKGGEKIVEEISSTREMGVLV